MKSTYRLISYIYSKEQAWYVLTKYGNIGERYQTIKENLNKLNKKIYKETSNI